jgi:4'-phosphopantetheinyl transferase
MAERKADRSLIGQESEFMHDLAGIATPGMTQQIIWPLPPPNWASMAPATHVWAVALDATPEALAKLALTLAPAERERAARFRFERDQNRFTVGRGVLRAILSCYLQTEPGELEFSYGSRGKPFLVKHGDGGGLQFNLAHSDGLALIAVTPANCVGVDIERIRPLHDADALVARFFCPSEIADFRNSPAEQKPFAFFNLWTRKEAWLKATGDGIGDLLNRVQVSFLPGEPARLVNLPEGGQASASWTLRHLDVARDFTAALAIPASDIPIYCWRWPEECQ